MIHFFWSELFNKWLSSLFSCSDELKSDKEGEEDEDNDYDDELDERTGERYFARN